jgi:hypothetical protein
VCIFRHASSSDQQMIRHRGSLGDRHSNIDTRGGLELAARAKIIGFVSNWKPHKCSTTADRLIVVFAAVEDLACSLIDN